MQVLRVHRVPPRQARPVSGAGVVRFWAALAGDGVDPSNDTAIYQSSGGPPVEIVREGAAAPGGGLFGQLPAQLSGNPAGDIAFLAPLPGPGVDDANNTGIYVRTTGGALSLIAREGAQAPGLPNGVLYSALGRPVLSADGQVAFTAQLRGQAGIGDNFALFIWGGGSVAAVVRTGDAIDVGGGEKRTVKETAFASGDAGSGFTQFAEGGRLVLMLTFTDKSHGLFAAAMGGCYPDLDGNGALDLFDFLAFVNLFNAQDPLADCDSNGAFDLFDFLCFVNAFNAGC